MALAKKQRDFLRKKNGNASEKHTISGRKHSCSEIISYFCSVKQSYAHEIVFKKGKGKNHLHSHNHCFSDFSIMALD